MRQRSKEAGNEAEVQGKITEVRQRLNKIIHLGNPTKKGNSHYTHVILGHVNRRLGKAKSRSLRILLDSGARSSIVLRKHEKHYVKKDTSGQMENRRWWLSDNPYNQCRIGTIRIGCNEKRDVEFSRGWIAGKYTVWYDHRSVFVVRTPIRFMFLWL